MRASFHSIFDSKRLAAIFDRPLIWLLPFFMAGIYQGWRAENQAARAVLALALALAASSLIVSRLCRPKPGPGRRLVPAGAWIAALLAGAVFFLGWGLSVKSLTRPSAPDHILNQLPSLGDRTVILGGTAAAGSIGRPGGNYRLLLETREIIIPGPEGPEEVKETSGLVRLSIGAENLDIEAGDYLRLPVLLRPISGYKNPGAMDFEKYWGAQGVWVGGFVKSPALISSWPDPDRGVSRWRGRAVEFIRDKTTPAVSGILAAQLAGRRGAVDQASEATFRSLGLSHILAVSGLHLGVCYGLAFWLIRLGLRILFHSRGQSRPRAGRLKINPLAAALALIPALIYAYLVGAASPVIRAAVAISAVVLAGLLLRRSDPWNILAAAAWLLLLSSPYRLFTASFQLSFAATASMLAVFIRPPGRETQESEPAAGLWFRPIDLELLAEIRDRLNRKFGSRRPQSQDQEPAPKAFRQARESFFKKAWRASLAGSIGTAPLVVWHFTWLPWASIPANMILTPIISFFVLVPGLLGLSLLPLAPDLAAWPLELAGGVMTALMPLMELAAEASGPGLPCPAPGPFFLLAFYWGWWIWLRGSAPWKKRLGQAGLILILGLCPGLLASPGHKNLLAVTILDVGQGSAIHLNLPDGRQMLIDGGGSNYFDPGESIITPYLSRQGLRRLDVLALTHPDQDHLKGLVFVSRHFRPREIWDAPWPPDHSPLYQDFLAASPRSFRPPLEELYQGRSFGPAEVKLLWPPADYQWPGENLKSGWTNDAGLVFRISWGASSFLITGDISAKVERELVERYGPELESTVLMAPHHGSRSSLSPDFLAAAKARWVVFSAGRSNSAGLPHPEAVRRAVESGAAIWRTDLSGAALFQARQKNDLVSVELINER